MTEEFDSPRELLRVLYWTLRISLLIVFILWIITDYTLLRGGGANRMVGLIIMAGCLTAFVLLSKDRWVEY